MNPVQRNQLTIAYLTTVFKVRTDSGEFGISPVAENPELTVFCKNRGIKTWALITPMNPGSRTLSKSENEERLANFRAELEASGFRIHDSHSVIPEDTSAIVGEPESERGFFIENLFPWDAMKLGFRYGQNAILVGRDDGMAELVWTEYDGQGYFQAHGET